MGATMASTWMKRLCLCNSMPSHVLFPLYYDDIMFLTKGNSCYHVHIDCHCHPILLPYI